MRRNLLGVLGAVIVSFAVLALPSWAAQDDDVDADGLPPTCHLGLTIDEEGSATVALAILRQKPSDIRLEQIEQALGKALGISLENVRRRRSGSMATITGRAKKAFPPGNSVREVDLTPLADLLRPLGVEQVNLSVAEMSLHPMRVRQYDISTSPTSPGQELTIVLGAPHPDLTRTSGILGVLFLTPIVVLWWRRQVALRATEVEPALTWFRFWRWVHWVTLGTWVVWLTAVAALRDNEMLPLLLAGAVGHVAVQWTIMVAPPWLITLFCSALSQEVFARLTKAELTKREILLRTSWLAATRLIPLLLAAIGVWSVFQGEYRIGAIWLAAALIVRFAGSRLALMGQALIPYAVTTGELRDRIFLLARQAGVALKQLYILPTGKMRQANAFAVRGGNVIITDHLVESLSRREVDAIAAHELGHLKFHHPAWLLGVFFAVLLAPIFWGPLMPYGLQAWWLRHVPVSLVLALVGLYFVSRRFEFQTDSYAAWLTGDPEALITALIKVHQLSLLPMRWGKWEEGLLTHPSTDRRLESIARQNGMSRRRLQEIVDEPDLHAYPPPSVSPPLTPPPSSGGEGGGRLRKEEGKGGGSPQDPGEPYSFPQHAAGQDLIFSTALKTKYITRIARTFLAAVLLIPGLVAGVVWWEGLTGVAQWGALAGGVILTCAGVVLLSNFLPLWPYGEVRRRLDEKMKAQGFDPATAGGIFVTFAPDSSPRLYEGFSNWDFGFLFLLTDRLCYVGEQTRFALRRDQIASLHLGGGIPRWWPAPHLNVNWKDSERRIKGTFNVRPGQARSMRQLKRQTQALEQSLRRCLEGRATSTEALPALADLSSPALGEVTSAPVQALARPTALLREAGLVFLLGIGLSLLLGLPLRPEQGGIAWYVPVVAILAIWVQRLPLLWAGHFASSRKKDEG